MDDQIAMMATVREGYEIVTGKGSSNKKQSVNRNERGPQIVHFDNWRSTGWDVFTHGGFLTYPHHDAGGHGTFSYVRAGAKLWGYIVPEDVDEHDQVAVLQAWTNYYKYPMAADTYNKGVKLGTVLLEHGAIL